MNRSMVKTGPSGDERELSFGSYHPPGCMIQMCDGSIRYVTEDAEKVPADAPVGEELPSTDEQ